MKEHESRFKEFLHCTEVDAKAQDPKAAREQLLKIEDGEPPTSWAEYLRALYRPRRYADQISFRAAAALLGVNIYLVCGNLDKPEQVLFYRNANAAVVVFLHHSLGHYTLLQPKTEHLPDYVQQGDEPVLQQASAPRGGGGQDSVDDSWIPAQMDTNSDEERPLSSVPCNFS